ncbi:glycosyl transferase family 2 [Methanolacinia petrolearia DSM 11571]|uniref:Glycosyl transferase family 2 n=2 Tax=Methanolacinia TaxID=230355 RepID=E1REU2_METP4|nr:glycosyl transferase family 2 [Methanolacinia petrolearia DSM 11571]
MNENPELQERLKKDGVICCISPPGNLSIVSNIGFEAATSDKVIITDSDTVFGEKCIKEMIKGLDSYDIVRATLRFRKNSELLSREIAEARDYVNSLPVVYTPGIGVTKRLPSKIKGFLFDNGVPFAVDANLNYRAQKENLSVLYLNSVWIEHSAEDIRHDLHAAKRIGAGCRQSTYNLNELYPQESRKKIRKSLKGVKLMHYPDLLRKKGLRVLIYQVFWDLNYYAGYYGHKK